MLDLTLIESTIRELESGDTNFAVCDRLASLYIILDHFNSVQNAVQSDTTEVKSATASCNAVKKELSDILPHYDMYCVLKRQYQMNMVDSGVVVKAFSDVLREVKEFIHILYSSTDIQDERELLVAMINTLEF